MLTPSFSRFSPENQVLVFPSPQELCELEDRYRRLLEEQDAERRKQDREEMWSGAVVTVVASPWKSGGFLWFDDVWYN